MSGIRPITPGDAEPAASRNDALRPEKFPVGSRSPLAQGLGEGPAEVEEIGARELEEFGSPAPGRGRGGFRGRAIVLQFAVP